MWLVLGCAPLPEIPADAPDLVHVRMDAGDLRVEAAGAWVDGEGTGRAVAPRAEVKGDPPIIVEGDRSVFDLRAGTATFEGGVRITRGDLEIRCARVDARYADGRLVAAEASGDVVVTRGDRAATAKKATIAADHLELREDVRVRDGDDRLTGATVTLWFEGDRLECSACRLELAPR